MSTLNYLKDFNLRRSLPLGKQIYEKLRDKIIYTELFPLTEIYESDLAKKLNVSRTPIRDALKKLENDGLVETIPQVKSVVSKINVKTIKEANHVRSLLETDIVNELSNTINQKQIKELRVINNNFKKSAKNNFYKKAYYYDNLLHQKLAIFSNKKLSWKIISQINSQIDRIRNISYTYKGNNNFGPLEAGKDHDKIIDEISNKNSKLAIKIMKKHIMSLERYVIFIKQQKTLKNYLK